MAITVKHDEKAKKILVEIDYDPKKKYPDSKSGKTYMVGTTGKDPSVPGLPDVCVGVNCYVKKEQK
jgi:hypothetical protein